MRKGTLPDARRVLGRAIDQVSAVHHPVVTRHVTRLRSRRPHDSPADVVLALEKQYLATVAGAGVAVGGAAAAPGLGTGTALTLTAGETLTFLQATNLFCLAVAEVHGQTITDVERRKTLVMTVLLGESGARLVETAVGPSGRHWGRLLADRLPAARVHALNTVLGRWLTRRYARRQGLLAVGRLVPFGIGAAVGGVGNATLARNVIAEVRRAFGSPPAAFDEAPPPFVLPEAGEDADRPAVVTHEGPDPARAHGAAPAADTKYRPLFDHLAAEKAGTATRSFDALDGLLTGGLPATARQRRSWWTTSTDRPQTRAWAAAGFAVSDVDLQAGTVTFVRS